MKILIAEDDRLSNRMLSMMLKHWGHEVVSTEFGVEALEALQAPDAPMLAVLDWMMPGLDGVTLCKILREHPKLKMVYVILLTTLGRSEDIVTGLESGANDYVVKPFNAAELRARIGVGVRVVQLQQELAASQRECQTAQREVEQLQGIIPICSYCKKIRNDKNFWQQVDSYFAQRAHARFSHGVCPDCLKNVMAEIDATPAEEEHCCGQNFAPSSLEGSAIR